MCGITTKWKQAFYDEVEPIKLKDPLAVFLGAINENEEFIFTYEDAVEAGRTLLSGGIRGL